MTHGFLWSCPEEIVLVDRTGLFDSNDQISEIPIFVLAVTQSHLSDFKSSISSRAKSGETLERCSHFVSSRHLMLKIDFIVMLRLSDCPDEYQIYFRLVF